MRTDSFLQIIDHITSTLQSNPQECFILEGYSQGAEATVNALSKLTGSAFDAVLGVFLIGDPSHKSGLTCNVDNSGGSTTRDVNGMAAALGSIPENWISKTLDVCIYVSICRDSSRLLACCDAPLNKNKSNCGSRATAYATQHMDLGLINSILNTLETQKRKIWVQNMLSVSCREEAVPLRPLRPRQTHIHPQPKLLRQLQQPHLPFQRCSLSRR